MKVLGACFSLIICEISLVASAVTALVVGILAAFALPVEGAKRKKLAAKELRRVKYASLPIGVF